MLFDDRLATVLRKRAASDAGLRTQFRQLLDLLGTSKPPIDGSALARIVQRARNLPESELNRLLLGPALNSRDPRLATMAGYLRLDELQRKIPQEAQSAILREPGVRLRSAQFVAFLAEGDPKPAAAAMATARLTEHEWLDLIPRLPVTARGFLRHRRDLPASAKDLLERLGVRDLVLPDGAAASIAGEPAPVVPPAPLPGPAPATAPEPASLRDPAIGELRRRIEAFQEGRRQPASHPRLPLGDAVQQRESAAERLVDLVTDTEGVVLRAEGPAAPALVGLALTAPIPGPLVTIADDTALQLRRRQPLRNAAVAIDAAPQVSGDWRMDAVPLFAAATGGFAGYAARLYRPNPASGEPNEQPGDAMRQVLHELRTPVNAIQGFAEIIQQQLFGNVPHEYRAHAAAIGVDSAKLLAGFDEVDRLVKLEGDALELEAGTCDFRQALVETVRRLEGVLRPRNAGFELEVTGSPFHVAIAREEAMVLCWRLLATAANALGPGEQAHLHLASDGDTITLQFDVPEALRSASPVAGAEPQRPRAISAGMFGPRFAFRLAEAEARAIGGELSCADDHASLRLPAQSPTLTETDKTHSSESEADRN